MTKNKTIYTIHLEGQTKYLVEKVIAVTKRIFDFQLLNSNTSLQYFISFSSEYKYSTLNQNKKTRIKTIRHCLFGVI